MCRRLITRVMPDDSVHRQADLATSLLSAHLRSHDKAADTIEGVARWWLGTECEAIAPEALRIALCRLVKAGALQRRELPSGDTLWYASSSPSDPHRTAGD